MCLGEICLHCPQGTLRYLGSIIDVIMLSCNAVIGMHESDFMYSEQLK